jgi:Uncharacterized conserved protein
MRSAGKWLLLACSMALAGTAQAGDRVTMKVGVEFQSAKEAVETAIANRGMIVNNVSHVGDMLERTGKETGLGGAVYGTAEVLEFCSAVVSRKMMEADPHNIVYCPYTVAVYTLPGAPKTAYISYRKPPAAKGKTGEALKAVDKLLQDIVTEAAQSAM